MSRKPMSPVDVRVYMWLSEPQEEVACSLCGKPTRHYCSTEACPDCHKSLSFEDCIRGTIEQHMRDDAWGEEGAGRRET